MFKTILVPTDGSALSDLAVDAAVDFAAATGAALVALAVAESYSYTIGVEGGVIPDMAALDAAARETAAKHVQRVIERAAARKVACSSRVVTGFSAAEEIVRISSELGCDLIWMGSHGRTGLQRLLMGSQTQKVLSSSAIPVLVYRHKT
ncbi:MAG: uspA [Paucimonas sp.]|nr:uspA [Paucimonas sp.]